MKKLKILLKKLGKSYMKGVAEMYGPMYRYGAPIV